MPNAHHRRDTNIQGNPLIQPSKIMEHTNHHTCTQQLPTLNEQYKEFRQHVLTQPPIPRTFELSTHTPQLHDIDAKKNLDMDAQLENMSLERGGSSSQMTYEQTHSATSRPSTTQQLHTQHREHTTNTPIPQSMNRRCLGEPIHQTKVGRGLHHNLHTRHPTQDRTNTITCKSKTDGYPKHRHDWTYVAWISNA